MEKERTSKKPLPGVAGVKGPDLRFLEFEALFVTAFEIAATNIAGWIPQEN
jgi:hypothetical protein